jgi:VWFA-related protein
MTLKSRIVDLAASVGVAINALDARGLYTTEIDASKQGASSTLALQTGSDQAAQRSKAVSSENVMSERSDGTGGTYFHNSNDLRGGLRSLIAAPEYVYVLECPLEGLKAEGTYHRLAVKVSAKDFEVQARRGYFAPKAPRKM